MTYLLSFWDFSIEYLPHNSVRKFTLAINRDVATSITTTFVSCPLPTDFWIIAVGVDKSEHIGWLVFSSHCVTFDYEAALPAGSDTRKPCLLPHNNGADDDDCGDGKDAQGCDYVIVRRPMEIGDAFVAEVVHTCVAPELLFDYAAKNRNSTHDLFSHKTLRARATRLKIE